MNASRAFQGTPLGVPTYGTIPDLYAAVMPTYTSWVCRPAAFRIDRWSDEYADAIYEINPARAERRLINYLDDDELERARGAIRHRERVDVALRFGASEKKGTGFWHGRRGEFCLVAGSVSGRRLDLYYRSLEMIGGFGYDLVLIAHVARKLGIRFRSVTFYTPVMWAFARRGGSNEKLYPKLRRIFNLEEDA